MVVLFCAYGFGVVLHWAEVRWRGGLLLIGRLHEMKQLVSVQLMC